MNNTITYKGRIIFNPENLTRKHRNQASWKYMAIVVIGGDVSEYYRWFIKKRYDIELLTPIRGTHVSFINDSERDICTGLKCTPEEAESAWNNLMSKWNGKYVDITIDVDVKTNTEHWWAIIPNENREELHSIRSEIGLGRPFFGMHMTIGRAVNAKPQIDNVDTNGVKALKMNLEQSDYIHNLIKKGLIS